MVFPVVMYGCESWTVKKAEHQRIDAFGMWCWRRLLRVPWTTRRSNQSILKEISPGISLDGMMLKLKLQYFGHLVLRMATQGPLRFVGMESSLGGLEAARHADLILFDLGGIPFTPLHDPVRQLVYSERGSSVRAVIVGGRILMEDGIILTVDESKILERIRASADRVRAANEAGWERSREMEPYLAD